MALYDIAYSTTLESNKSPLRVCSSPFAEIELQHTRERRAAGIAAAKKRGVYKGREKGATKARLHRAKELKNQGLSALEIARAMNISERTVRRYLST